MKKLLVVIILAWGLTAVAMAAPKILIPQTHWDLGKVPQNSSVNHSYWIKNVGDDTLKNISVKPG